MESPSPAVSETELLENLPWVQALARRLVVDRAAAEDVAQEAMLAALERPPARTEGPGLRAWLARVTRTTARQDRRGAARRLRREVRAARKGSDPSAFDVVARAAMQQRVVAAVMELDEPDRSTVLLRYLDGLSARAIAARCGEEPAAVRQRLARARAKLRGRLEREFGNDGLHALVPFAFVGAGNTVLPWLGTLGGGVLVTKTTLAIGVGAVAMVIGAVAWWSGTREGVAPPPRPEETDEVARMDPGAPAKTASPHETIMPAPETPAPKRVAVAGEKTLPGALYELLDPRGRIVPAARVALCGGGTVLAWGTTDEAGRFATELDGEGEARLLVVAEGWAPQVHPVPLTPLRHEVSLRAGGVVSGWIVVDGHAPADPIPLRLIADRGDVDPREDLGIDREALAEEWRPSATAARTADGGSFRIAGLPADWSGRLDLPSEYRIRNQIDAASDFFLSSVRLERAVEGLRIDVVRRPVLSGRVVDFRENESEPLPVEGVLVRPSLFYPGDANAIRYQRGERTDAEGRFRIPLLALSTRGGYLSLEPREGGFRRRVDVEPMERGESRDLGDLALVDPAGRRTLALRVRSVEGEPIPRAVAGTDGESPISEPSDEEGRTSLRGVVPGASTIVVYAAGWEVTSLDVPAEVPDELVITMRRAATLELRFRLPDGEPASDVTARLWANVHPYRDEAPIALYEAYRGAGCAWYQTVRPEDGTVVVRLHAGGDGRALLSDVRPGVALLLRVEGRFGATVHEQDLPPLAPEEWKVVNVELPRRPLTLHGRVVDETGAPIPSARYFVSFTPPDSPPGVSMATGTGVDDNGEFLIPEIFVSHIHLVVQADGYVEFRERAFEVPLDERPLEVVLAAGRTVTVTLRDEEGHPVDGRVHSILPTGAYSFGSAVEGAPGEYLLRGLPEHEVEIQAVVYDVTYKKRHDPLVPTLAFTIPTFEDVKVRLKTSGTIPLDARCYLRLVPLGGESPFPRYVQLTPGFSGDVVIRSVAPGPYQAVVSRHVGGDDDGPRWEDLCARVPFVVRASGPTSVTVEM